MTLEELKKTLSQSGPPPNVTAIVKALWYDGRGDWEKAHNIAQDIHTKEGSWIHAYLHRKEGDMGNASYWYHRAGKSMPSFSPEDEWEELVIEFLKK